MQVKVYLNDWFYNCGIIGFLEILEHNNDNFAIMKDNYIEFDTENLRNFHKYYFKYFFDKYNIAKSLKSRTESAFNYLENNLEKEFNSKEEEKQVQEKIRSNREYIKNMLKPQLDKVKKIDETIYNEIKTSVEKIKAENTVQGIKNLQKNIFENLEKDLINKKITLNLFKSQLSKTYFGQPSFLNVSLSNETYEKQLEKMYKDYVSNIVESGFINDVCNNKYDIVELTRYLNDALSDKVLSGEIEKIYSKILKNHIDKNKPIEDVQKYLKENVLQRCCMCENEIGLTTNYYEGNFIPLAISSDNARNFFWNQNVKMPICDICKLMLFCIPAGITNTTKTIKEAGSGKYKEDKWCSFINYDVSVEKLYKTNVNFKNITENKSENPFTEVILNIVGKAKSLSKWQLDNIFVVEFSAEYGSYSRIEYFNIKRYVGLFFVDYAEKLLSKIYDYKYKLQVTDYILKNKDIKYVINDRLRYSINENISGYDSYLAARIRLVLNLLKKEETSMTIEESDKKLKVIYGLGVKMHEEMKHYGEENKLSGYTYKMLNAIKAGNKKEFMDVLIRLHMSMGKDVSPIFIEAMQNDGLDFESIGHSFLSGLISNKYEKKNDNNVSDGTKDTI